MCRQKPKLLFLCHSASRNGATILLLDFLKWLVPQNEFEINVLINGNGELVDSFRKLAPTKIWRSPAFLAQALSPSFRGVFKTWLEKQSLRLALGLKHFDLIYANTAATAFHLQCLSTRSQATLLHIHELGSVLRLILGSKGSSQLSSMATHFIAASNSCQKTLTGDFQIPAAKVDIVHSFISPFNISESKRLKHRAGIRRQLGWPDDAFIVGGCGSLGWRKGTDVFLQVARNIRDTRGYENVRFLWVGGNPYEKETFEFEHDLQAFSLQNQCRLVAASSEVLDYYCAMDAFAMTSREDPFPLVMLEAGALGLPIVCFANSGGPPEFVGDDGGCVAPYLDVEAFATHIKNLRDNQPLCGLLGLAASKTVQNSYTTEVQAPKILQVIRSSLSAARG